jgi:hypothetical protein
MPPYKLLVLGHHPIIPNWESAFGVFGMLTFGIFEAFRALPHVETYGVSIGDYSRMPLPQVDAVLINSFYVEDPALDDVKRRSGARYVASIRENHTAWDHSFAFVGVASPKITIIKLPCCKRLLRNVPKVPGSILVDHHWWDQDHTSEIEEWLRDYKGPMFRLDHPRGEGAPPPPWIQRMPYQHYPAYLASTETFERHVITHIEGYGFGIVDFAARGTQVLAPPDLIPKETVADLGIPVFRSKGELLSLLAAPVGPEWSRKIDLCTDYADCANVIDQHFQSVL